MALRPYWKGYLKLSLVTCPVQMMPATSESEKVRFHTLNRDTHTSMWASSQRNLRHTWSLPLVVPLSGAEARRDYAAALIPTNRSSSSRSLTPALIASRSPCASIWAASVSGPITRWRQASSKICLRSAISPGSNTPSALLSEKAVILSSTTWGASVIALKRQCRF